MDLKKCAVILMSVCALAACSSSVKLDDEEANANVSEAEKGQVESYKVVYDDSTDPTKDPKSELYNHSVYFDLDSYTVKEAYQPVVKNHSNYLKKNKIRKVIIQGNTDERGGHEYNLALGQKRAEAVRQAMALQGVSDDQMEAVSFGKEKPVATGSNEAAWSKNRRADIVYD